MTVLICMILLLALAPAAAWLGRRHGRSMKGAAALGAAMFGLGQIMDPPSRNIGMVVEEKKRERENDRPVGE